MAVRAGKIAHQSEVLATKSGDKSLIPGTHIKKEKANSLSCPLNSTCMSWHLCMHVYTQVNKHKAVIVTKVILTDEPCQGYKYLVMT